MLSNKIVEPKGGGWQLECLISIVLWLKFTTLDRTECSMVVKVCSICEIDILQNTTSFTGAVEAFQLDEKIWYSLAKIVTHKYINVIYKLITLKITI